MDETNNRGVDDYQIEIDWEKALSDQKQEEKNGQHFFLNSSGI